MTLNGCVQPISRQSGVGVSDAVKAIVRPHVDFESESEEINGADGEDEEQPKRRRRVEETTESSSSSSSSTRDLRPKSVSVGTGVQVQEQGALRQEV